MGHAEENPVWLPATRAKLNGGLEYFGVHGYAHDWATGWSSTASAEWEVDVVRDGVYQVQALYLSEPAGIGARLVVQAGAKQASAPVANATKNDPLPTGLRQVSPHYLEFSWNTLSLGEIALGKGGQLLQLAVPASGPRCSGREASCAAAGLRTLMRLSRRTFCQSISATALSARRARRIVRT